MRLYQHMRGETLPDLHSNLTPPNAPIWRNAQWLKILHQWHDAQAHRVRPEQSHLIDNDYSHEMNCAIMQIRVTWHAEHDFQEKVPVDNRWYHNAGGQLKVKVASSPELKAPSVDKQPKWKGKVKWAESVEEFVDVKGASKNLMFLSRTFCSRQQCSRNTWRELRLGIEAVR